MENKIEKQTYYTKSEAFILNDELKKYRDINNYNKICSLLEGWELDELCDDMIDDINESKFIKP